MPRVRAKKGETKTKFPQRSISPQSPAKSGFNDKTGDIINHSRYAEDFVYVLCVSQNPPIMRQYISVPLLSKTSVLNIIIGVSSILILARVLLPTLSPEGIASPALDTPRYSCTAPRYWTHILSYDPLILHIENFLTERERKHILDLA